MAGFGGAIKLVGEDEYRKALQSITSNLRACSAEMRATASSFDAGDKSTQQLATDSANLSKTLDAQKSAIADYKVKLNDLQGQYAKNKASHQELVANYNNEKTKLEEIGRTLGTSSEEYKKQAKVVEELESAVKKSGNELDSQEKNINKYRTQIANAETNANKTAKALDELGKEAQESGEDAKKGSDGFTVYKGILADLGSKAIQSAISGLKRLGEGIVDVGKQSYELYSQNEQLVGGVETLFGESANQLIQYANEAYKTAGVSANTYMEQATSFSATLLQGLGGDTAKAVEYADLAIRDMSDNANKMGTDIGMIQNAYQGFAKDNYTMLDNLKIGYGGTASEMARLVNESGVLGDAVHVTAETVKDVPFDKIIEAIHKTQQEIGITGTTTLEAEHTIEGSTKALKASWDNLLVAIASDNADIGKSVQELTNNIQIFLQNAIPRIKQIITGAWDAVVQLGRTYAPELTNTIVPILEKIGAVVKTVGGFIVENFSAIASVVMVAVSAFTALNAVMAIQATVSAVTTAIAGLTEGVSLATKAQVVWNAVMEANPIGAVITAVVALIAVVGLLATTLESDVSKAHEQEMDRLNKESEAVNQNVQSWESLKNAQQENVEAGMSQITHSQALVSELQNIVDANGRVKEGYEARASFITSQLSDALGIEISMVDGVIQNYGDLMSSIDSVMEKKKAQIILDSQESMYAEAIKNQDSALREFTKTQDEYSLKKIEVSQLEQQLDEVERASKSALTTEERTYYNNKMAKIGESLRAKQEELDVLTDNYNSQKNLISEYAYNIGQYETNMALAHEGRYSEMTTVNWDYVKQYGDSEDAQLKMLEDGIKQTEAGLNNLIQMKEQSGSTMYDTQIRQAEQSLQSQKESLAQFVGATTSGMDATTIQWQNGLDRQLSLLTGSQISFKQGADGLIQMYVDGVAQGQPRSAQEMAGVVNATVNEINSRQGEFTDAGINSINGYANGINNQDAQSGVFRAVSSFAGKVLSTLMRNLQEHSPSKATEKMGVNLLKGLGIGIQEQERDTLNQVAGVGQRVVEALDSELNSGVTIGEVAVASQSTNNQYSLISAFKEALGQMEVVMDDEQMGKFVDKTVTQLVYT